MGKRRDSSYKLCTDCILTAARASDTSDRHVYIHIYVSVQQVVKMSVVVGVSGFRASAIPMQRLVFTESAHQDHNLDNLPATRSTHLALSPRSSKMGLEGRWQVDLAIPQAMDKLVQSHEISWNHSDDLVT